MVDIVGNVGAANTSTAVVRAAASAAPVVAAAADNKVKVDSQVKPISPIIRQDSVSGVLITQYLNNEGQVRSQFPSTVAVAYLRAGLTQSGELRKDKEHSGTAQQA